MKKLIGLTTLLAAALSLAFFGGCSTPAPTKGEISKAPFGTALDGAAVDITPCEIPRAWKRGFAPTAALWFH